MGKITAANLMDILESGTTKKAVEVKPAAKSTPTQNEANLDDTFTNNPVHKQKITSYNVSQRLETYNINDNNHHIMSNSGLQSMTNFPKHQNTGSANEPLHNIHDKSVHKEIMKMVEQQFHILKQDFKASQAVLLQELEQEHHLRKKLEEENLQLKKSLSDSKQLIDELCKQMEVLINNMPSEGVSSAKNSQDDDS